MFTCNTCTLTFDESAEQRDHMRGDWHRYNLKRKVAQLPAISEAQFNEKVAVMNKATEETPKTRTLKKEERQRKREELQEKKRQILEIARKAMAEGKLPAEATPKPTEQLPAETEATQPTEQDKPEDATKEAAAPEGPTEEEIISLKLKNKVDIPPTTCLFCKKTRNFETIDENLEHLWKAHNLYIPERKYLVDVEGLLNYLGEKVGFGFCIACGYQGRTCEAAREHMLLKRHMRIPYETEDEKLEISQFYDFSLTYAPRTTIVNAEDVVADDDGDWEDVSGDEDDEEGDDDDEEEDEELLTGDDIIYRHGNSLVLPLGQVLGHRSNQRYYRQSLAPERILTEGQGTVIAAETRHMLTVPERQALQESKRAWAKQKKREDVNDRRAAKFVNNQPYYRDQLLQ
ncbi:C2H2-type zinc finger protein [Kocuria palustris]|nr:C2H2-type zinc finger protein [Kocuria palustris]